jgi:hypothetical protein
MMRSMIFGVLGLMLTAVCSGCGQQVSDNDAIRGAINSHLAARGNLNTDAFETKIQKVDIQGDQARADVVFRVKGGPGMMQLTYNLKKTENAWGVVESNPIGSNFTHPALDANGTTVPGPSPAGAATDIFDAMHQKMGSAPAGAKSNAPSGSSQ